MKIHVKAEGYNIRLWLPLMPRLIAWGMKLGKKYSDQVPDPAFVVPIVKELKKWKKRNGKLTLVEVDGKDGEKVKIIL